MSDFLRAENVNCSRELRAGGLSTVREISIAIEPGAVNVICGSECCGKNLLLRLLGLLETPDDGEIFLHGTPTRALDENARLAMRNRHFGYVFAEPFLLNTFSVIENVAMPLFKIGGAGIEQARAQTAELLDFVGLRGVEDSPVETLLLPEQQRVSLARALATHPEILCVESAGEAKPDDFFTALERANKQFGVTVIFTSQAQTAEPSGNRIIELSDGRIARDSQRVATVI